MVNTNAGPAGSSSASRAAASFKTSAPSISIEEIESINVALIKDGRVDNVAVFPNEEVAKKMAKVMGFDDAKAIGDTGAWIGVEYRDGGFILPEPKLNVSEDE